jgi:aspartate/methionine/tyrosine aminotransferase
LWIRAGGDSSAFAQAALRQGVAVVPGRLLSAGGDASGAGEYVRLAFTQPPEILARAVPALASAALAKSTPPRPAQWSA